MRVAVCFYGQPRFVQETLKLSRPFYSGLDIDFFGHIWGNSHTRDELGSCLNFTHLEVEQQRDFGQVLINNLEPKPYSKSIEHLISPLYSRLRAITIAPPNYDLYVLTRTDVCCIGTRLVDHLESTRCTPKSIITSAVRGQQWVMPNLVEPLLDDKLIASDHHGITHIANLIYYINYYLFVEQIPPCPHRILGRHTLSLAYPYTTIRSNFSANDFDEVHGNYGWYFYRNTGLSIV
jgi:hypothetical protein